LFIDLEHTGWSVAANDFGVFLSHGENLVDGLGVHIVVEDLVSEDFVLSEDLVSEDLVSEDFVLSEELVSEDLVLSENLVSEDLVQVQFLEDGVLVKVVLDEGILVKGILDEVILEKGVLVKVILDEFFLEEVILDELVLDEFFLDEFFLDKFVLDDLVQWGFWNADDLSINNLDVVEVHCWLSGDGIDDLLSFNILGQNLNVGDDFSNWGLVQKEITVDFLQQVFVVDVVDIETLLSVVLGVESSGVWEDFTFNIDETVLVQSLDSTEVIEEVDIVTGDTVDGANEFGIDSTDLFDFNLQGLDLWVDVLVEENWVSEVLLELTGGPELLEEWRSNVLLEDWVLHVLTEKRNGHVLTEEFSGVQFFDCVDGVHAVSSKTLNKGKVDTFGLVGGQRKSTDFSELSEFSIEKGLLLQLKELFLLQQGQRSSGDGGHEESDSDESLHVERASL
jgi:hypothetical protein